MSMTSGIVLGNPKRASWMWTYQVQGDRSATSKLVIIFDDFSIGSLRTGVEGRPLSQAFSRHHHCAEPGRKIPREPTLTASNAPIAFAALMPDGLCEAAQGRLYRLFI